MYVKIQCTRTTSSPWGSAHQTSHCTPSMIVVFLEFVMNSVQATQLQVLRTRAREQESWGNRHRHQRHLLPWQNPMSHGNYDCCGGFIWENCASDDVTQHDKRHDRASQCVFPTCRCMFGHVCQQTRTACVSACSDCHIFNHACLWSRL